MITSVNNETVKDLAKLSQKKYRQKHQQMIVEGIHLVEEALKNNLVIDLYATKAYDRFNSVTLVSPHVMKKITEAKNPPTIIALCNIPKPEPVGNQVLILEHVQDPGNLGTLLRSALAFDFKTVILDECVDYLNAKVIRSTQGALFNLNIIQSSVAAFHDEYPHTLLSTHVSKEKPLNGKLKHPFALILGNEGKGVQEATLNQSDYWLNIETSSVESLNVSVAGSILMCQLSEHALNPLIKG